MKKLIIFTLFLVAFVFACTHESLVSNNDIELRKLIGITSDYILPGSEEFDKIPQSDKNPLTKEKIDLGKFLFFDPAFGVEAVHEFSLKTFACGSCHVPEAGFRPGRMQGIADGGYGFGLKGEKRIKLPIYNEAEIDAQGARPLTVLNVAFVTNSMWNGSFGSDHANIGTEHMWGVFDPGTAINHERLGNLEGQNIEGLKTHRMLFNKELVEQNGYKEKFDLAFADIPEEDRYNRKTASFAISAYLRALLTNEAPFQRWLRGEMDAMSERQKEGALLFFGKAGCVNCHNQPNLGSNTFHAVGVKDLYEAGGLKTDKNDRRNLGRGGFTGKEEDMFKFRVPQLYNLADSGPYFHGASKHSLKDVVEYFNLAIPENSNVPHGQLSAYFKPLNLSAKEVEDLTLFISISLRDPNLNRYVPNKVLSGLCFPNNDLLSRDDMNCL